MSHPPFCNLHWFQKGSSVVPIGEPFLGFEENPLWKGFDMEHTKILPGTKNGSPKGSPIGTAKEPS
jgi:hypothetical protein